MAKIPKTTKRYCPYCNKRTDQKIKQVSTGGKKRSMSRGSKIRAKLRGKARGIGSWGRYSKPAVTKFKRKTKTTKKAQILFTCSVCGKGKNQKKAKRMGKLVIE
jgi:ribosomal protein L44E